MTFEEHADVILAVFGLDHHSPALSEYAAILAAVRAVYEDGQVAMREAAMRAADNVIYKARTGEIDNDLRCVGYALGRDIDAINPADLWKDKP